MPTEFDANARKLFAERLRRAMTVFGYDRRGGKSEFAARYGVKIPVVSDWRKGRYMPEHAKARRMADEFQCSADWFYYGEGNPPGWFADANNIAGIFTKERRAIGDVQALQIAMESFAVALCKTQQGAAAAFLADVEAASEEKKFSLRQGLLAQLVGIARASLNTAEVVAKAPRRGGSGRRTKP